MMQRSGDEKLCLPSKKASGKETQAQFGFWGSVAGASSSVKRPLYIHCDAVSIEPSTKKDGCIGI